MVPDGDRKSYKFNVEREPDVEQLKRVWQKLEEDGYHTPYQVDIIRSLMDHYERTRDDADPPSYNYQCGACGCRFDDHTTTSDFDGHLAYACPVCRHPFVELLGGDLPTEDLSAAIDEADECRRPRVPGRQRNYNP